MKAIVTLKKSICGYWDGGEKRRFDVELDRDIHGKLRIKKDKRGKFIKVHCWDANAWWHVAAGKTERLTLSYAIRHFSRDLIESVEYIKDGEK